MSIAIYLEGGGDGKNSKAMLRLGMDAFLRDIKEAFRQKRWRWKLVCCGGRNEAYRRFTNACTNGEAETVVLLVDSEESLGASTPRDHLRERDRWDFEGVDDDTIHLMVQTMEAWIVADPEVLNSYYGQGFQARSLPRRENLEEVSKQEIASALDRATQNTQKGKYHKIRHARQLLEQIDPAKVRQRCAHCKRLFDTLLGLAG